MVKKIFFTIIILVFVIFMIFFNLYHPIGEKKGYIDSGFHGTKDYLQRLFDRSEFQSKDNVVQLGIISHHLPVAAPLIFDFYKNLKETKGSRQTFVIIGPDHFEAGYQSISSTFVDFMTPFGVLETDKDLIDRLGVAIDDHALIGEHSMGVQSIFIKLFFPDARIVPLIVRTDASSEIISQIAQKLSQEDVTIIVSVDFSHYLSLEQASLVDKSSEQMIKSLAFNNFILENVDSPASMEILGQIVKELDHEKIYFIDHANSADFTGAHDNTTSYFSVLYEYSDVETLMFVGDIMLSRGVDYYIKENNDYNWPFLNIKEYLDKADLLIGNLEGPISDKGRNVGSIYSFRADPKVIEGLTYAGFDVLDLANNHIGDWGYDAMEQTFNILENNNITYIGAGNDYSEAHEPKVRMLENGIKIAFLGYTNLGPKNLGIAQIEEEALKEDINTAKSVSDLVVVCFHFGEEYMQQSNAIQQYFARLAIDLGADLVIGHHPHVIQEIEEYNDKYIVYSLGNFVFDQYFSEKTMQGLIFEVDVDSNGIVEVRKTETKINKEYQVEILGSH